MSDYDLTDIDGVGPARAETIAEAGFEVVDNVAGAELEEFRSATDINKATAEDIIDAAGELVYADDKSEDEDVSVEEDEEQVVEEEVEDPEPDVDSWITIDPHEYIGAEPTSDGEVAVPIQMETRILMHVIHITLEEATKKHQSSSYDLRNDAYSLSRKLMALVCDVDEEVDETVLLTQSELRSLYRAVSQGSANYASRSGIPKMWGTLESFKDVVNDLR